MKTYIAICMALLMTACATNPPARYLKKGANEEEFTDMAYQCKKKTLHVVSSEIRDAYGNVTPEVSAVNCTKFNACLASKGFVKSANGSFVVTNDKEMECKE